MFGFEKNIFEKATKKFIQFTKKTVQKVVETATSVFERGTKKFDSIKEATKTKDLYKDFVGGKKQDLQKQMMDNFKEISMKLEYEQKISEYEKQIAEYEKKISEYEAAQQKFNEKMRADYEKLDELQKKAFDELGVDLEDNIPEEYLPEEEKAARIKKFKEVYEGDGNVALEKSIQKKEQFLDNLLSGYEDDPVFADFVEQFRESPIESQLEFMRLYADDLKQQYLDYKSGRVSMMHVHDTLKEYNDKLESLNMLYS